MNQYARIILVTGMLWSASAFAADSPVDSAAPQPLVANSTNLLQSSPKGVTAETPAINVNAVPPATQDEVPAPTSPAPDTALPTPAQADKAAPAMPVESSALSYPVPESKTAKPSVSDDKNGSLLTLAQAQAIALEYYPQIIAAEAETKAARQEVVISRSSYLPQVAGNAIRAFAGQNTRLGAPGGLNNPTVLDRGSMGVGVSQLITDFGRTSDLIESSKLELEAQKARSALTKEIVLLDATRAYFNVLRAQALLKVAETTLKARKTFREQIALLRDSKLKSNLDVSIANQVEGEANLLLLKAKSGVDDAQATLSEALGYGEPRTFVLADDAKVSPPPVDMESLVQQAMDHNPELSALQAQAVAAEKRAQAEAKAHYPTVSALGYAGDTPISENDQPIRSRALAGGINISIPFYTGGRLSAQEHEAADKANIAQQDVTTLKNQLLRDIRIAFGDVQTAWQNISVTQELVKNADEALDLTQERYNIGSSSIVDLSQAQLAQTQAQIEDANATYEYLINRALLDYKIGNGILANTAARKMLDAAY